MLRKVPLYGGAGVHVYPVTCPCAWARPVSVYFFSSLYATRGHPDHGRLLTSAPARPPAVEDTPAEVKAADVCRDRHLLIESSAEDRAHS